MERLKIDDFLRYKFLSNPTFSPNGESLAFMVHESDLDENGYHSTIWLYELSEKSTRQLTTFGQEKIFIWLDEQTLLFSSLREEKDKKRKEAGEPFTVFYKIDIFGGEAAKAFEIPAIVTRIEKLNQNQFVLTAIYDNNMTDISKMGEKEKEEYLKKVKEEKDYQILDEIPFWSNGSGFTNKKRIRLFLFDLQTLSLLPITDEFTNVENFSLNGDKTKLLFIANSFKDKMEIRSDLYLYNILDGKLSKLTHEDTFHYNFAHFMKDMVIFAGSNMKNYGINENPKFYLLDPKTSQVTCLTPNFDLSLHNSVNSDCRYGNNKINKVDGEYLYFVTTEWHSSFLNRVGLTGKIERLTRDNGSVEGFDVI
ncbi:MAG: S9 family peptidase, partial [Pseudothermotoga sp.]